MKIPHRRNTPCLPISSASTPLPPEDGQARGDLFDSPLIRGEKFSRGELGVCYFHLPFRLGAQTGAFPTSRD